WRCAGASVAVATDPGSVAWVCGYWTKEGPLDDGQHVELHVGPALGAQLHDLASGPITWIREHALPHSVDRRKVRVVLHQQRHLADIGQGAAAGLDEPLHVSEPEVGL